MLFTQLSRCLHWIPGITWRKSASKKTIYLSFDDGPIPDVTPWVLDTLDRYGIKATFFCVGENVARYPELFEQIKTRGHQTGNHSYNHLRAFRTNPDDYLANVEKADKLIGSSLFRPPHGELTYAQFRALRKKYELVQWDVISRDYNAKLSPDEVFDIVRKGVRKGSILVFHDSLKAEKNLRAALPRSIEFCLAQGYVFDVL
jgi:peptidoglycan/xylan/chitin deacetylase (PgdA/CDA1 family)